MKPNIAKIYMVWRPAMGTRRIPVGFFHKHDGKYKFHYIKEGVIKAKRMGFVSFPAFPETDKIYDENIINILSKRINDPNRSDIKEYYQFWEVREKEQKDPFRVLAHTTGTLATDNFEFLVDYYGVKNLKQVSEIAGLSKTMIPSEILKEGDILDWKLEKDNSYDPKAVAVYKGDIKIGYVKAIHNQIFHKKGSNRLQIRTKKIEANGHLKKIHIVIQYI